MTACGFFGLLVLAHGYVGPALSKRKGLSEEEEARDAIAGTMFRDGDDF